MWAVIGVILGLVLWENELAPFSVGLSCALAGGLAQLLREFVALRHDLNELKSELRDQRRLISSTQGGSPKTIETTRLVPFVAPSPLPTEAKPVRSDEVSTARVTNDRNSPSPSPSKKPDHPESATLNPATTLPVSPPLQRSTADGGNGEPPHVAQRNSVIPQILHWLWGGNVFVRLGIALLIAGVVLLLRYSFDRNLIPVWLRHVCAAGLGSTIAALGWRLRTRAGSYGLLLQGAGVTIGYLTTLSALRLYHLIGSIPAFGILVALVACGNVLAVVQRSQPLALTAVAGGYIAPVLVSTHSGNHVALFAFYVLLGAGIVWVAIYRSWRLLNLVGFTFTFVISSAWGWLKYQPENYTTTQPFLIAFFLLYVAAAVLFATRPNERPSRFVDGTLLFGVPFVGLLLQAMLVKRFEYGVAISALAMGLFYSIGSIFIRKRWGATQASLRLAFVMVAVTCFTIALPYAFSSPTTSGSWALEGMALIWFSGRTGTKRWRRSGLGLLGLSLSALGYAWTIPRISLPIINSTFVAALIVAACFHVASYSLGILKQMSIGERILLAIGQAVPIIAIEMEPFNGNNDRITALLVMTTLVSSSLFILQKRVIWRRWPWLVALPIWLGGRAAVCTVRLDGVSPALHWGLWSTALVGLFAFAFRLADHREQNAEPPYSARAGRVLAATATWVGIAFCTKQIEVASAHHGMAESWSLALWPSVLLVAFVSMRTLRIWPLAPADEATQFCRVAGPPLGAAAVVWFIVESQSSGAFLSGNVAWIPLGPLEVATGLLGLAMWPVAVRAAVPVTWRCGTSLLLGFAWAHVEVLRGVHHWGGVDWAFEQLINAPIAQTALALLWGVTGLALVWVGRRRTQRLIWFTGAALLLAVTLKLLLVDALTSGTAVQIISFVCVGGMLLFVGYLAPLPPRPAASAQ